MFKAANCGAWLSLICVLSQCVGCEHPSQPASDVRKLLVARTAGAELIRLTIYDYTEPRTVYEIKAERASRFIEQVTGNRSWKAVHNARSGAPREFIYMEFLDASGNTICALVIREQWIEFRDEPDNKWNAQLSDALRWFTQELKSFEAVQTTRTQHRSASPEGR